MQRTLLSILIVFLALTSAPAALSASSNPCFSISWNAVTADGEWQEKQQTHATYRPLAPGDRDAFNAAGLTVSDCNFAVMPVGRKRHFTRSSFSGHAVATSPSGSEIVDVPEEPLWDRGNVNATLTRTEKGAVLEFIVKEVAGETYVGLASQISWLPSPHRFELTEEDLLEFRSVQKTISLRKPAYDGGNVIGKGTATLTAAIEKPLEEMIFDVGSSYEQWIPMPLAENFPVVTDSAGETLRVKVKIQPEPGTTSARKDVIEFTLESEEATLSGNCANYPPAGSADSREDLQFAEQSKQPNGIEVTGARTARTRKEVSEATIVIEAFDTGAFGRLIAKAPELDLTAEYRALDRKYLPIPLDTNNNRIADAWEMKVLGHLNSSRDQDDETAPLQDTKGDGITLFNEYRGVVVLENGRHVHKRLDPSVKELFVLDPANVVPSDLWKRVAHMKVIRIDESLADSKANEPNSPLVNFNASDSGAHPFYALRIRKVDGDYDADAPDRFPKSTENPILPKVAYVYMENDGIRGTEYIKVFPDRVRMWVARRTKWIEDGLADPASESGMSLTDPANGFSAADAAAALAVLKTAEGRENVVRRILNTLFVHELGHACGNLPDHQPSLEPGYVMNSDDVASRQCLMHAPETFEFRRMIVLTALGHGDPDLYSATTGFCNFGATYQCARMLSTKNW